MAGLETKPLIKKTPAHKKRPVKGASFVVEFNKFAIGYLQTYPQAKTLQPVIF